MTAFARGLRSFPWRHPWARCPPKNETARAVGAARVGRYERVGQKRRLGPVSRSRGSTPCETGAFAMSDKPISPLRQRMIDDMTARRLSEATQKDYVRNVRN